jgi:hypothetical protein
MLSDLIELVSQPPGNVIYHLITLFALQIVFALSFSRWRRNRHDRQALRMVWAAGSIFLLRLGLLLAGLAQPLLASPQPQRPFPSYPHSNRHYTP